MSTGENTSTERRSRALPWVFLAGLMAGLLLAELLRPAASVAQIPDAAAQRQTVAAQSQRTNQLLGEILGVLKTGTLKVQVVEKGKASGSRTTPPPPPPPRR